VLKPQTRDDSTATGESTPEIASSERRSLLNVLTRRKALLTTALSAQNRSTRYIKIAIAVVVVIVSIGILDAMRPGPIGKSRPDPTISGFKPVVGGAGTVVHLRGTSMTDVSKVLFNGVASDDVTILTDRSIDAVVPKGATTGPIAVRRGGTAKSVDIFTVKPTPTLTEVRPQSGGIRTTVVLIGENFSDIQQIRFDDKIAREFEVKSPTEIEIKVPSGARTGRISVTTDGGTAVSTSAFNVVDAPVLIDVNPTEAGAGQTVEIRGQHFAGVSGVTFGDVPAQSFSVTATGSILATVPNGAATGRLSVTTPGGTASNLRFKVALPPVITGFQTPYGAVGTLINVVGANLARTSSVTFNGIPALVVSNTTSTLIKVVVPAGATTGPVTVVAPGGTVVSSSRFVVLSFKT
jgi:hypothetical protein